MPSTNHQTEYRPRDRGVNFNTFVMGVGGSLIVGLLLIIGYFCKASLEGIESKMDASANAQSAVQTDVTTIKAQLPALTQRVDKLETSQHDMWQRMGNPPSTTRPTEPRTP